MKPGEQLVPPGGGTVALSEKSKVVQPCPGKDVNYLNYYYLNIQSLNNKHTLLEIAAHAAKADLIFVTEVWLDAQRLESVSIPNYVLASYHTRNRYGGTAIWVKKHFHFIELSLTDFCIDRHFEICGISIKLNKRRHIYLCVYRTPDSNFNIFTQQLLLVLERYVDASTDLFLCGDFNVNWLEPGNNRDTLLDIFSSCGLENIVKEPTRNRSLLDYVCVGVSPDSMRCLVEDITIVTRILVGTCIIIEI